jgi:purine-binding chemotaxis protein CheW
VATYARFMVGPEQYCVLVDYVVEIRELGDCTPVPGTPPAILGVRNVRGQVLPVADLAGLLGVPSSAAPGLMLVAEDAGRSVGLAISDVVDVGELPEPSPAGDLPGPDLQGPGPAARPGLVTSTILTDGELVGVVDVPKVFVALAETAP